MGKGSREDLSEVELLSATRAGTDGAGARLLRCFGGCSEGPRCPPPPPLLQRGEDDLKAAALLIVELLVPPAWGRERERGDSGLGVSGEYVGARGSKVIAQWWLHTAGPGPRGQVLEIRREGSSSKKVSALHPQASRLHTHFLGNSGLQVSGSHHRQK